MSAFPCTTHALRHDWTIDDARALFELPFNDLLFVGQTIHRQFFDPNKVQMSNLLYKNGWLPRGLRLLSTIGQVRNRSEGGKANGCSQRSRRGGTGFRRRGGPFLYGRGVYIRRQEIASHTKPGSGQGCCSVFPLGAYGKISFLFRFR